MNRGGGGPRGGRPGGNRPGSGQPRSGRQGDDKYTPGPNTFNPPKHSKDPELQITLKENHNVPPTGAAFNNPSVRDLDLPTRQAYGTAKQNFQLRTNYFDVKLLKETALFKYTVTIEPVSKKKADAITNGRKRCQLYKLLFEEILDFSKLGAGIATDYAKTVITSERLYDKSLPHKDYEQVYRNEFEQPRNKGSTAQSNEQRYKVTVKSAGMVPISELIRYINSEPNDPSDFTSRLDAIQALNIIVAGCPNKDPAIFQSGQNKFFRYPRNEANKTFSEAYGEYDLGGCLIGVRGYYSSIRTSTSRILLNVNAQCSAFYPEMNLLDLFDLWVGQGGGWDVLERFINKLRVRTEHTKRVKTIRGFSPRQGNSNSIRFDCDDYKPSVNLSVAEYIFKRYKKRLRRPAERVVNCGSDEKPAWMPPELCFIMPGQAYRGTMEDHQTTKMLNIAARGPAENARRIKGNGLPVIGIEPRSETLVRFLFSPIAWTVPEAEFAKKAFQITVGSEMLPVHARLLSAPPVLYKGNSRHMPKFADWNIKDYKFYSAVPTKKWSYLMLGSATIPEQFWGQIQKALDKCGMGYTNPEPYGGYWAPLQGTGDDDNNDKAIQNVMMQVGKEGVKILLVVLDSNSAAIRARVKKWGELGNEKGIPGVHTVCVLSKKLHIYADSKNERNANMYFANFLHKFNLKLGGINHTLGKADLDMLAQKEILTMVVGIDVTHPAPRSMENAPSIVGMVASVDKDYGQWPGGIRLQKSKQEIQKLREASQKGNEEYPQDKDNMVSNIAELMKNRLEVFREKNNRYPDNILIYRDGVSEGQYDAVLKHELRPVQELCRRLYHGTVNPPKITIVVVGKRHHTRFYPMTEDFADTWHNDNGEVLFNSIPGTVVDRGITMLKGWDFYLQSHAAIKGTAKPAHYVVIHNGIGLTANQLEKITHNLCYIYGRATKAVSICPPVYYADIICERGRCYFMKELNTRGKPLGHKFQLPLRLDVPVNTTIQNDMFYI